jgi:hypothetical protein
MNASKRVSTHTHTHTKLAFMYEMWKYVHVSRLCDDQYRLCYTAIVGRNKLP